MSAPARSLISGLCTADTSKRLGNISGGAQTVKKHAFFNDINWEDMYQRRQNGPIVPHLRGPADTRNFDDYEPESGNREPYTEELRGKWEEHFRDF